MSILNMNIVVSKKNNGQRHRVKRVLLLKRTRCHQKYSTMQVSNSKISQTLWIMSVKTWAEWDWPWRRPSLGKKVLATEGFGRMDTHFSSGMCPPVSMLPTPYGWSHTFGQHYLNSVGNKKQKQKIHKIKSWVCWDCRAICH